MMKVWMIWIQADDHTWLEAAWDDESTADNNEGWRNEVDRCRKLAYENNYEMRICSADITGVYELFDTPTLANAKAEEAHD